MTEDETTTMYGVRLDCMECGYNGEDGDGVNLEMTEAEVAVFLEGDVTEPRALCPKCGKQMEATDVAPLRRLAALSACVKPNSDASGPPARRTTTMPTPKDTAHRAYELAEARRSHATDQWARAYANDRVWPSGKHAEKAERLQERMNKAARAAARAWDYYLSSF